MSGKLAINVASVVIFAALSTGCAAGNGSQTTIEDMFRALTFSRPAPSPEAVTAQLHDSLKQQPESTFELLQEAKEAGIPEKDLAPYYPASFNPLLDKAEVQRAAGDSSQAGKLYRSLLAAYPETAGAAKGIQMSPGSMYQQIKKCADDLMQQGLVHYRAGRLELAIETWTEIEAFLPEHQPSQTAVETTRTQMQTLRQLGVNRQLN